MMNVVNTLTTYECDTETIEVRSDIINSRVVLTVGNKSVTVVASELEKAIRNATNH